MSLKYCTIGSNVNVIFSKPFLSICTDKIDYMSFINYKENVQYLQSIIFLMKTAGSKLF